MKRKPFIPLIALLLAVATTAWSPAVAQEEENKVRIKISIDENGEKQEINKEIDLSDIEGLSELMEELELLKDIEIKSEGEQVEIKIKKRGMGEEDDEFDIDIDFPFHWEGDMSNFESEPKAFLGVHGTYVSEEEAKMLKLKSTKGARVTKIVEGSSAEKAGLRVDDVIVSLNGENIEDFKSLAKTIGDCEPEEKVSIAYYRAGELKKDKVTLGKKEVIRHFAFHTDENVFNERKHHFEKDGKNVFIKKSGHSSFLGVFPGKGSEEDKGVRIGGVFGQSTAEEMGLEEGDIITKVNGTSVDEFKDLVAVMKTTEPGQEIEIEWESNGKKMKKKGVLKQREEAVFSHQIFDTPKPPTFTFEKEIRITIEDIEEKDAEELTEQANLAIKSDSDLSMKRFEFSPNPNKGKFNLRFELPTQGNTRVHILDGRGKKIFTEEMNNFEGSYDKAIDISHQPAGIYFLIISQEGKQFNKKIVKQ